MCESAKCQELARQNERKQNFREKTQELANSTGEWFAIYEEQGELKAIKAEDAVRIGIPVLSYVTPKL